VFVCDVMNKKASFRVVKTETLELGVGSLGSGIKLGSLLPLIKLQVMTNCPTGLFPALLCNWAYKSAK
jgi:hypothetical protein